MARAGISANQVVIHRAGQNEMSTRCMICLQTKIACSDDCCMNNLLPRFKDFLCSENESILLLSSSWNTIKRKNAERSMLKAQLVESFDARSKENIRCVRVHNDLLIAGGTAHTTPPNQCRGGLLAWDRRHSHHRHVYSPDMRRSMQPDNSRVFASDILAGEFVPSSMIFTSVGTEIVLWDVCGWTWTVVKTPGLLKLLQYGDVSHSMDGCVLAAVRWGRRLLVDIGTHAVLRCEDDKLISGDCVTFSPLTSSMLAVADVSRSIRVFDGRMEGRVGCCKSQNRVCDLAFSPSERFLVSGDYSGCQVIDVRTWKILHFIHSSATCLRFLPGYDVFLAGAASHHVDICHSEIGGHEPLLSPASGWVAPNLKSLDFSQDGKLLIVGFSNAVKVFTLQARS